MNNKQTASVLKLAREMKKLGVKSFSLTCGSASTNSNGSSNGSSNKNEDGLFSLNVEYDVPGCTIPSHLFLESLKTEASPAQITSEQIAFAQDALAQNFKNTVPGPADLMTNELKAEDEDEMAYFTGQDIFSDKGKNVPDSKIYDLEDEDE